jgi:hypothetical protein
MHLGRLMSRRLCKGRGKAVPFKAATFAGSCSIERSSGAAGVRVGGRFYEGDRRRSTFALRASVDNPRMACQPLRSEPLRMACQPLRMARQP